MELAVDIHKERISNVVIKEWYMKNRSRGYLKQYEFDVPLHAKGIMAHDLDWCNEVCKEEFGWYFKDDMCIATFESSTDALFFTLARL
tara:strand:+ start:1271 stop:1534 length:264 start_codon:yes stop_codon:yes gene_type:complete